MDDPTPHLERFESYEQACREFRWLIPERLNIASAICRKHPDAVTRVALNEVREAGSNTYTFGGLDFLSDKFATALSELRVGKGDSVAVILPQSAALAVAQLGALKMGAVVVPLPTASGPASLQSALAHSNAKALVVHSSMQSVAEASASNLPNLCSMFVVRDLRPGALMSNHKDFWSEVDRASSDFDGVELEASAPAFLFHIESQGELTSVVHSHRSVIGQLAAFEMCNNFELDTDSALWTPDCWSSAPALLGVLYPAWWYGCSIVAATSDDYAALSLLEQGEVTRASSEGYAKPETGWIAGTCKRWFSTPPGSVGRGAPGHSIEVIDDGGHILPPGKTGRLAVHRSDPALFIGYHNAPKKTAAAFVGDWFLTGDFGYKNKDGDLYVSPSQS